jgi:RND family efflux transporter MFP subunit
MDERTLKLDRLRIDRNGGPRRGGDFGRVWWLLGGALAVVLSAAAFLAVSYPGRTLIDNVADRARDGWQAVSSRHRVAVRAAVARAAADGSAAGTSLLDASGYVVALQQATVSAKITGKLIAVTAEEGMRVEKDQVIAKLDDTNTSAALNQAAAQVAEAQGNLSAAQVMLADATPIYRRNASLLAKGLISQDGFDTAVAAYDTTRNRALVAERSLAVAAANLQVAQRNQDDTVVRAPFSGVVTVKAAQAGEIVSPISAGAGFTRTGIATLVDMDSLVAEIDVSENLINLVHPDQPAIIKLNAYPDWPIPGKVIRVIPSADRSKATVKVRVGFQVKDSRILPEVSARVSFLSGGAPGAPPSPPGVVVPPEVIQVIAGNEVAFVIRGDTVERRVVRRGERTAAGQTILSGIAPGESIAIAEPGTLVDGAAVRIDD